MKPGSFTQIYIHLVFAVKSRQNMLHADIRSRVFEYMSGILANMNHKTIIINGISNHVHLFFGLNPTVSISDTVHDLKRNSSIFINEKKLTRSKFYWQEGYGGFSYSRSQISKVYEYIQNQEVHHKKSTFRDEYIGFLKKYKIEYDEKYLFDFLEE